MYPMTKKWLDNSNTCDDLRCFRLVYKHGIFLHKDTLDREVNQIKTQIF